MLRAKTRKVASDQSSDAPSARELVTAIWSGDKMIIWGGRAADDYLFDGAMYDPSIDQWVTINTNCAPRGRCFTQLSGPVGSQLCGEGSVGRFLPEREILTWVTVLSTLPRLESGRQ